MNQDKLKYLLHKQELLQDGMMRHYDYQFEDNYDAVVKNAHWCMQELAEMLQELKGYNCPWKIKKEIDISKIREEAIDALHFFLNIFIFLNMNAETIVKEYDKKFQKNVYRLFNDWNEKEKT